MQDCVCALPAAILHFVTLVQQPSSKGATYVSGAYDSHTHCLVITLEMPDSTTCCMLHAMYLRFLGSGEVLGQTISLASNELVCASRAAGRGYPRAQQGPAGAGGEQFSASASQRLVSCRCIEKLNEIGNGADFSQCELAAANA